MSLAGWMLALSMLGLDAVVLTRAWAADRHCDYTRPGVEPYWDDQPEGGTERVTPRALPSNGPDQLD